MLPSLYWRGWAYARYAVRSRVSGPWQKRITTCCQGSLPLAGVSVAHFLEDGPQAVNAISPAIQQASSDEIDLAALFHSLWEQRRLVVLVTLLVGLAAAAYAFLTTPEYQVQSVLRPAAIKDLDALNRTGVYKLTPEHALQRVGAALESYDSRLEFFRANQGLFEALRQPNRSLEQTFESFNREAFNMLQPDPKKLTTSVLMLASS